MADRQALKAELTIVDEGDASLEGFVYRITSRLGGELIVEIGDDFTVELAGRASSDLMNALGRRMVLEGMQLSAIRMPGLDEALRTAEARQSPDEP